MDLIFAASSLERAQPLLRVALKSGYRIMKLIESNADASRYVESLRPDALIIRVSSESKSYNKNNKIGVYSV